MQLSRCSRQLHWPGRLRWHRLYLKRQTTEQLNLKRYVAAGDRAYVVGVQDGTFPPIGWHISGHMGGVWAQRAGKRYETTVNLPQGWNLTIGYALPRASPVRSVTLNGAPAAFQVVDTNRGREIRVMTDSAGEQALQIELQ